MGAGDSEVPEENSNRGSQLRRAAIRGDVETARRLLQPSPPLLPGETGSEDVHAPVPVDATDRVGYTALMLAASYGHLPMVRLLCEYGADPNRVNNFNGTPFFYASQRGSSAIVNALLEHEAASNPQTPGIWAKQLNFVVFHAYEEKARELLGAHAAELSPRDLGWSLFGAVHLQSPGERFVHLLLGHGANPSVVNGDDETPLLHAASRRCGGFPAPSPRGGKSRKQGGDRRDDGPDEAASTYQNRDIMVRLLLEC